MTTAAIYGHGTLACLTLVISSWRCSGFKWLGRQALFEVLHIEIRCSQIKEPNTPSILHLRMRRAIQPSKREAITYVITWYSLWDGSSWCCRSFDQWSHICQRFYDFRPMHNVSYRYWDVIYIVKNLARHRLLTGGKYHPEEISTNTEMDVYSVAICLIHKYINSGSLWRKQVIDQYHAKVWLGQGSRLASDWPAGKSGDGRCGVHFPHL